MAIVITDGIHYLKFVDGELATTRKLELAYRFDSASDAINIMKNLSGRKAEYYVYDTNTDYILWRLMSEEEVEARREARRRKRHKQDNIIDLEPKANENISRVQIPSKGIRKKFSPDVRKLLYIHAGGRCELCGKEMALEDVTIDHIKPLAMGGTNDVSNLACTCFGCNHLKGSAVPESFFQRVNDIFMFQMEKKMKHSLKWKLAKRLLLSMNQ